MSHSMFEGEKRSVRMAILVLVMASMPVETHIDHTDDNVLSADAMNAAGVEKEEDADLDHTNAVPAKDSWTKTVLMKLIADLDLSEDYYEGYTNLLRTNYDSVTSFELKDVLDTDQTKETGGSAPVEDEQRRQLSTLIKSFKAVLVEHSAGVNAAAASSSSDASQYSSFIEAIPVDPQRLRMQVVAEVLVFLVVNLYYDARGRQTVRNLAYLLECSPTDVLLCEHVLAHSLSELLLASRGGVAGPGAAESKGAKAVRYAKIGAASVGVGALLAITGGLAAPAIAAAAVVAFGSGGAAVAGALATVTILGTVFGATGAGLAGYKMSRRTSGLTEFAFEQPMLTEGAGAEDDEQEEAAETEHKLAVMIMISGWMKEKDDYMTAFGVLPPDTSIGAKERLARFYMLHNPAKLRTLEDEVKAFERDMPGYQETLLDIYNVDLMARASLLPPKAASSSETSLWRRASERSPEYVAYMTRCMGRRTAAAASAASGEEGAKPPTPAEEQAELASIYGREAVGRLSGAGAGAGQTEAAALAERRSSLTIADLEAQAERLGDDQGARMNAKMNKYRERYWSWRQEPELASVYELYLLRYETDLQVELGHSIEALIASLRTSAVQKMLTVTVLSAMMSALLLPITLVKLTDVIDNTWTLAIERADMAGIELAHALASRLQGTRPVTLVGHSIGARVIYSCLKELYRLKLEATKRRDDALSPEAAAAGTRGGPFGMGLWRGRRARGAVEELDDDVVEYSAPPAVAVEAAPESEATPAPAPAPAPPAAESPESGFFSFKSLKSKLPFGGDDKDKNKEKNKEKEKDKEKSKGKGAAPEAEAAALDLDAEVAKFDGILQDVVLLGAPVNARSPNWRRFRSLVSGRFINGYSSNDMVLRLLYRYERWQVNVAGVQPISGVVTAAQDVRSTVSAVGSGCSNAASAVARTTSSAVSTVASSANSALGRTGKAAAEPGVGAPTAPEGTAAAETEAEEAPDPAGRSHETNAIGIENVDLSFLIDKHTDYCYKMRSILLYLNFKGADVDVHGLSVASLAKFTSDEDTEKEQKERDEAKSGADDKGKDKNGWYPGKMMGKSAK